MVKNKERLSYKLKAKERQILSTSASGMSTRMHVAHPSKSNTHLQSVLGLLWLLLKLGHYFLQNEKLSQKDILEV